MFGYHFQLSENTAVRRNTLQEPEVQRHPWDWTASAKCQACPRENEAMHCGVVSRKKCKKLLAFIQFFHLQDVSSEQSYHCIAAQMKIQEQLLDSHTGSQLLRQHKTEPKGCRYRCSEASFLQAKYTHLIQENEFCKFQFKTSWPYTTSDVQGISTKIWGILICKANFWEGRTRTRVGSQKCHFAIMHFPEWRILVKWTTLTSNIGNQLPMIPAQTHGSHCNSVLRGRMATTGLLWWVSPGCILQCLTSVGTTTVLLVICPCVNFTRASLFAFPFVELPSLNS